MMINIISKTKYIDIRCDNHIDDIKKVIEMIIEEVPINYIHSLFYEYYVKYGPYGHCGTIKIISEDALCNDYYTTFLISITYQRMAEHVISFICNIIKEMENNKYVINSVNRMMSDKKEVE